MRDARVIEILAVLGFPLLGSAVLALVGERAIAPRTSTSR